MGALDLAGQRFGKLVAIKRVDNDEGGHAQWECVCDCGKTTTATASALRSPDGKKSCGCAALFDLSGKKFGMLSVIRRTANLKEKVAWLCQCDCGQFTTSVTYHLVHGKSTSCGCVRTKHHGKGTRLYRIWSGMKSRTTTPGSKYWDRYGGRGIKMCPRWASDFGIFQEWAKRTGYEDPLTIDRIENDQGYCPWNCQWLTLAENAKKGNRNAVKEASI